jgi:hypothetical protein
MLSMLAVIGTAASQEHRPRKRGSRATHPEVDEAFRATVMHFKRIFGDDNLRGRAAWTHTKPPQAKHLSAIFIHGVLRLVAADRPKLAEELRELMEKELAAIPGPRPGRRYQ